MLLCSLLCLAGLRRTSVDTFGRVLVSALPLILWREIYPHFLSDWMCALPQSDLDEKN